MTSISYRSNPYHVRIVVLWWPYGPTRWRPGCVQRGLHTSSIRAGCQV